MATKRKSQARFVMWDTCTLIWCIDHAPDKTTDPQELKYRDDCRDAARNMITEAKSGQIQIAVSAMAMAELIHPHGDKTPDEQETLIAGFMRNPYMMPISVTHRIAKAARLLRRKHPNLKIHSEDFVQILTAILYNIPEFVTTDGEVCDKRKRDRRLKQGILKYDNFFELADKSGKLRILSPIDRQAERRAKDEAETLQREAEKKAEAEKKKGPGLF